MPGPDDPRSGGAEGTLAGPDAPGAGTAGRAGMREGTLYRRDRRAGAGCPVRGGGAGAGCHDRGDGAGGGERAVQCLFVDGDAARLRDYFSPGRPTGSTSISATHGHPTSTPGGGSPTRTSWCCTGGPAGRGQIHFKTDNRELFEYSLFQFPKAGYELSEVTRDLHGNGVCGIMTDYEEKFHDLGTPINRCVGTKLHLEQEPKFRPIAGPWIWRRRTAARCWRRTDKERAVPRRPFPPRYCFLIDRCMSGLTAPDRAGISRSAP